MTVAPSGIREMIHGVGPLPVEPSKRSPFLVALAQALWYVADGRPFDELAAASGLAFGFEAQPGAEPGTWSEGVVDRHLEVLARSTGVQLRYVELARASLAKSEPGRAWVLLRDEVAGGLDVHRPVLARGGWPGAARGRWGVITGWASNGLPAGYVYGPGVAGAILAMDAPPWQLVVLGADTARPAARELAARVVVRAAADLAGDGGDVIRTGDTWRIGPNALDCWAGVLEAPPPAGSPADAAAVHRRLALDLRDRRGWAAKFLADTAGLRLGQVRGCRALARDLAAASAPLDAWADAAWVAARSSSEAGRGELAATVRDVARRERELARLLAPLGEPPAT